LAYLDGLQAAQDALYARMGVAATWTPAGGGMVACTALLGGGDEPARFRNAVMELNAQARTIRVRVRELLLATTSAPLEGDAVTTPDGSFVITGDPRHPLGDHRRFEWEFDLADA
jgi:hypothetical protein